MSKQKRLRDTIDALERFKFCGPSDDPDEQTAVTTGYRYLVVQLQRLAAPLLSAPDMERLNNINVDVQDIYTAYDAKAEVDALLPEISEIADQTDVGALAIASGRWVVSSDLISKLEAIPVGKVDLSFLVRLCREINSSFSHGNNLAALLLMRGLINYVPPIFGHATFAQVAAQSGRSHRELFTQLEDGLRKVADFQTHRTIGPADIYPSAAQVEPYRAAFELLLHAVVSRASEQPDLSLEPSK